MITRISSLIFSTCGQHHLPSRFFPHSSLTTNETPILTMVFTAILGSLQTHYSER